MYQVRCLAYGTMEECSICLHSEGHYPDDDGYACTKYSTCISTDCSTITRCEVAIIAPSLG